MGNQLLGTRRYPSSVNHKGFFNYSSQHLIRQAHDCSSMQFPTKYRVSSTSHGLIRNQDDLASDRTVDGKSRILSLVRAGPLSSRQASQFTMFIWSRSVLVYLCNPCEYNHLLELFSAPGLLLRIVDSVSRKLKRCPSVTLSRHSAGYVSWNNYSR